jgi:capsular exopolysaccharide synthesis family protein
MIRCKLEKSVLSFKDDKSNTGLERVVALSNSLTAAQIATIDLKGQEKAIHEALSNPDTLASFVASKQSQGRDSGDKEYEELRRQLVQHAMMVGQSAPLLGSAHPRALALRSIGDTLKQRIADKDIAIAKSQLVAIEAQRVAAEEKESELREAVQKVLGRQLELTPTAAEYARLEADADRLQKQTDVLDQRIAEVNVNNSNSAPLNVHVLEPARASENPIKPRKTLTLAIALMAGWVLGIGFSLAREWHDSRLRTPDEILTVLGMPVVASVPKINKRLSAATRGQMVRFDARSPVAEAYRSVRTSIHLGVCGQAKTILLASPMEGDGKSTTASNLAIAFAQAGERTLVVDCDLREPVQHLIFESDGRIGLTNVMAGEVKLQDAIAPTETPGLYLLPCGPVPVNPSELLTSKKFARLMQALADNFDRIIIDSPPLMMFTDAHILAASADATLLVLRMNQSMRQLGSLAMDGLAKVGANVVGAVANDASAGRAYRKYGSSWQYVTRVDHYRGGAGNVNGNGHDNGNGNGNGHGNGDVAAAVREAARAKAAAALTINEPDWSADVL